MATLFSQSLASGASIIGVGLDWRSGLFVQEIWHKDKPQYLIANLSNADVAITVHEFDSTWRLGQPLNKAEAGPWKVPAGGKVLVDPSALSGEKLWRFVVAGKTPLGVLPSVRDPGYQGAGYATGSGLNGSGGFVPGVYMVQPELKLTGGSTATLVLHLPSKCGVLKYAKSPDKIDDPLRPANLIVESAKCETLTITADDKQVVIDTEAAKGDVAAHEVTLTVKVPAVTTAQLQMIDGWLGNKQGGGNGITRGFWIEPK